MELVEVFDRIKAELQNLSDDQIKELEWLCYVECRERFVALGDDIPVDGMEL